MYSNYQQEPDFSTALSRLTHLNAEELKELLNDDSKFEEIMKDMQQFKELETEKEMLIASNKSLAEFNLSREPQLQEGKQRLMQLSENCETLLQNIDSKLGELRQRSGNSALETTYALLQTAAAETEEESEKISEKFMDGDLELDEFLEQFVVRRKLMHLRRVKVDKMAELMSTRRRQAPPPPQPPLLGQNTSQQGSSFPYYPSAASGYTPYPLGMVNMPQPGHYGPNVH